MDPITSGLTILQVIETIAQASALLYGYVASVRTVDSSSKNLLDELRSIGGVLTTVMEIEKDASLPDNLRGALSHLMAIDGPVAKLQVELKNLLPDGQQSGKMGTKAKLIWPFKEKKAAAIVDKLKKYYCEISAILAIDSWTTLKGIDEEVKDVHREVKELKDNSVAQKNAEDRQKLLGWMKPVHCNEKHDASCRQRNAATGRWIFHADHYKIWNTSDCAFLWLNGQPGAGKTILASAVIDEIQSGGQAESQALAYFYCDFRDEQTTSAAAVLRSLVFQLLRQSKDDWITKIRGPESNAAGDLSCLRKLWNQQSNKERCSVNLGVLRDLLVEVSKLVARPVLVIDALDECKDHRDLLRYLITLAEDTRLRLFITSRSEPDIKDALHDLPTVSLKDEADQMQDDICLHITEQLKTQTRLLRLSDLLKKTILEKLLEKAKGMFRWVQCQLDEIVACKRPASIRNALDNLPKGLDETYDRIIRSIEERGNDDGPIAQSCLLWLAGALTPLTLDQLNEAMMIEVGESSLNPDLRADDPMDIVVACGSLVSYDEATGVVSLSHYSVKEYLISRRPINILKSVSDMHARISVLLITYLLCDSVYEGCAKAEDPVMRIDPHTGYPVADPPHVASGSDNHPLLSYAVEGLTHLRHVSDEDPYIIDALSRLHSELLQKHKKNTVLADQIQTIQWRYMWSRAASPSLLFIPLELGQPWMVECLVRQQPHLLDEDIALDWGSPLIFAIYSNPDFLTVLLKLGVDLNKPSSFCTNLYTYGIPRCSYTPISWAAAIGSQVAVDLLLSQTEINLPDDIIYVAAAGIDPNPEVIRNLRQRGADVNFTVSGSAPIHASLPIMCNDHYLPAFKALIEPPCDLSVQDWTARTALHIALDHRLGIAVTYLLEHNARLSGTATLRPDMWSWAQNKEWFPEIQAAALAADQPCTRIKGKVIDATGGSQLVEFPGAVAATREGPHPIRAVVVSVTLNDYENDYNKIQGWLYPYMPRRGIQNLSASLLRDKLSLQKFDFSWNAWPYQRVSSRLFDYHQGDEITRMLPQLSEDNDSPDTSLFLETLVFPRTSDDFCALEIGVEDYTLDIYRGPVH